MWELARHFNYVRATDDIHEQRQSECIRRLTELSSRQRVVTMDLDSEIEHDS
jgi:hypothetical protein